MLIERGSAGMGASGPGRDRGRFAPPSRRICLRPDPLLAGPQTTICVQPVAANGPRPLFANRPGQYGRGGLLAARAALVAVARVVVVAPAWVPPGGGPGPCPGPGLPPSVGRALRCLSWRWRAALRRGGGGLTCPPSAPGLAQLRRHGACGGGHGDQLSFWASWRLRVVWPLLSRGVGRGPFRAVTREWGDISRQPQDMGG